MPVWRVVEQNFGYFRNRDVVICLICVGYWYVTTSFKDEMKGSVMDIVRSENLNLRLDLVGKVDATVAKVGAKVDVLDAKVDTLDEKVDVSNSEWKSATATHDSISKVKSDIKELDKILKDDLMQFINDRFMQIHGYLNSLEKHVYLENLAEQRFCCLCDVHVLFQRGF